jgi:hypothetical protein
METICGYTVDASAKPAGSAPVGVQKTVGKTRLLTLGHLDGRTLASRRARELISAIEADLGGPDNLSTGSSQLAQRAAILGALIESAETQLLAGEPVDLASYLSAVGMQRRVLLALGLSRRTKDVTPDLAEYLGGKNSETGDGGA